MKNVTKVVVDERWSTVLSPPFLIFKRRREAARGVGLRFLRFPRRPPPEREARTAGLIEGARAPTIVTTAA